MKKFILIAAASLLCASCIQINSNFKGGKNAVKGEGPVITKDYDFRDFDALCVNGNADVVFIQDENWKVTLTTQENIPEYLDYKVENGILLIQAKNRRTIRAEEARATSCLTAEESEALTRLLLKIKDHLTGENGG